MNRKGEFEIAISKRLVERTIAALVIIALVVLYLTKSSHDPQAAATAAKLEDQVKAQATQISDLQKQLAERLVPQPAPPVVVAQPPETPARPEANLSGSIQYNWSVVGKVLLASDYNADQIANLSAQLAALQANYDNDNISTTAKDVMRRTMDDDSAQLRTLNSSLPKYELDNVTVTVDNGLSTSQSFSYELCWETIECLNVVAKGTFTVPSGQVVQEHLSLDIPTIIIISKQQILQVRLLDQNGNSVFSEEKLISGVQ